MATTTPNYGLRKPTNADTVNVALDIAGNMDLLDAHAHSGTYVGLVAAPTGVAATDTATLQAAVAAAAVSGGTLILSAGTYQINAAIPGATNVTLQGQGRNATKLIKAADVVLLDIKGAHAATTTTARVSRFGIRDLTLDGNSNVSWTQPLCRMYYADSGVIDSVNFLSNYGEAVKTVECWDTYFSNCRLDSVGGTDGTKPAFRAWGGSADGAVTGIGHSADNSNNLWFIDCVFESFRDGGLWLTGTGGGALAVNKVNLLNTKLESTFLRGPFVKLDYCNFIGIENLNCTVSNFDSGYSTPIDTVVVTNSNAVDIRHYIGECNEEAAATVRTFLSIAGTNNQCTWDALWFSAQTVNKPTVAAVEFAGTNNDQSLGAYGWFYNPGNATLLSGSPTTVIPQGTIRSAVAQPLQMYGAVEQQIAFRRTDQTNNPTYLLGRVDATNKRFRLFYADDVTPEFVCWETDPTGLLRITNGATIPDAKNVALGTTTGSKIGTAASQKLGFWNATPVTQPVSGDQLRTALQNVGILPSGGANLLNLVDADVNASAAIAKSKLASLALVDADVSSISSYKIADPDLLTTGESTVRREDVVLGSVAMSSGTMRLSYFTARKTETITQVRIFCANVAAGATPTVIRVGLYTIDGSGNITLVASTPNDTTLLASTGTAYTKALSVSYAKVAGTRYAMGLVVVTGATAPQVPSGANFLPITETSQAPRLSGVVTGQTDLPGSVLIGSIGDSANRPYYVVLP